MVAVGRKPELAWLNAALARAMSGLNQIRFIAGSAGAGKSTLIEAFAEAAQRAHPNLVVIGAQCDPHTGPSDPYLPFLSILEQLTAAYQPENLHQETAEGGSAARMRKLAKVSAEVLVQYAPELVGTLIPGSSVVVSALKFAAKQAGWLDKLSAVEKKVDPAASPSHSDQGRIVQQYTAAVSALAKHHPLLIVLDDLQWVDSSSCDLLFHLAVRAKTDPVLIVGMYRPHDISVGRGGERHPLATLISEVKVAHGEVHAALDDLSEERRREFATALLDSEPHRLCHAFTEKFFRVTGGHALFCVELLRHLKERGDLTQDPAGQWIEGPSLDWEVLPARVEGVIEERIQRLEGELRDLLTLASVEGASFTVQVLAGLQKCEERALLKSLSGELDKRYRLVAESSSEKIGRNWLSRYLFSHAFFQQYLYKALSHRERMLLHGDVAAQLEEIYKGHTAKIGLQLARHYRLAGEELKAVGYLMDSSAQALQACAYREAQLQLQDALDLIVDLPEEDCLDRELEILVRLSTCLKATCGWNSPEVIEIYRKAIAVNKSMTSPSPSIAPVMFGLWAIRLLNLELEQALVLAEESLEMARRLSDPVIETQARASIANTCFWAGHFDAASVFLESTLDSLDTRARQSALVAWGQDPVAFVLMFRALIASVAGRCAQALDLQHSLLRSAEELNHPFSLAIALQAAALLQFHLANRAESLRYADRLIHLAKEKEFPFYLGIGLMCRGWALPGAQGLSDIEAGYELVLAGGTKLCHSLYSLFKIECLRASGKPTASMDVVNAGLRAALQYGELAYVSELYRHKGELLFEIDPPDRLAAKKILAEAVKTAQTQGAALFEQRAAASLERILGHSMAAV